MPDFSAVIKEIGRGRQGARAIPHDAASELFAAMLDGSVPELELGAILLAYRVKGETPAELHAFQTAIDARLNRLAAPEAECLPVCLPTYNGARRLPNLLPLLALGLQARGIPVLLHGGRASSDTAAGAARTSTLAILERLDITAVRDIEAAQAQLQRNRLAFVPIDLLSPGLAALMGLRGRLGLRNSAHTLVKMLQPFSTPALQLISVTHPDYLTAMREYFTAYPADVLLMRGTEGEAFLNPRRPQEMEWLDRGVPRTLPTGQASLPAGQASLPAGQASLPAGQASLPAPLSRSPVLLPDAGFSAVSFGGIDAATTAHATAAIFRGERPMPAAIAAQIDSIVAIARQAVRTTAGASSPSDTASPSDAAPAPVRFTG